MPPSQPRADLEWAEGEGAPRGERFRAFERLPLTDVGRRARFQKEGGHCDAWPRPSPDRSIGNILSPPRLLRALCWGLDRFASSLSQRASGQRSGGALRPVQSCSGCRRSMPSLSWNRILLRLRTERVRSAFFQGDHSLVTPAGASTRPRGADERPPAVRARCTARGALRCRTGAR